MSQHESGPGPRAGSFSLGIDLGGTKIEARLFDPGSAEIWRHRVATPSGRYAETLQALTGLVSHARQQLAGSAAMTIGIGTPGAAQADGRMKNCNSTCLNGQPLQRDIEAAIGQPVVLMNDANCLALSEATDGAAAGAGVVLAVILGTGSGAGIVVNGRVLTGPNAIAGEWGHNALPWCDAAEIESAGNWLCYCGRRGCVEALVAGPAIARDHVAHHGGMLDAAGVAARAAAGEAEARATLDRHANRLARALAGVINLLDPDVIVLGGGLSLMPHLYEQVPHLWGRWVFGVASHEPLATKLVPALHGGASGARGAAWIGRGARALI